MKRMTTMKLLATGLLAAAIALPAKQAFGVAGTGTARQIVIAAIAIANVSDLVFPQASPGAAAATVAPGTAENGNNGSFNVTGQANTAYTITLPSTINMTNGANTIAVNTFVSFPAAGANGLLNASGSQLLLVGATRAALAANQALGTYTGTYTVDVVY
jgi:hypothetical protein